MTRKEYLVFSDRVRKNDNGSTMGDDCREGGPPCIWATGGDKCPVGFYKQWVAHRPENGMDPDSPLFLQVRPS